jgi:hypothetical protein
MGFLGFRETVGDLQIHPEARVGAEMTSEPDSRIRAGLATWSRPGMTREGASKEKPRRCCRGFAFFDA